MSYIGLRFLRPYLNSKSFRCDGFGSEERFIARVQRSQSFAGAQRQRQRHQCLCQFSSSARALAEEGKGEDGRVEHWTKPDDLVAAASDAAESSSTGNRNGAGIGARFSLSVESSESYHKKRMEKLREYGAYENLYPRLGPPIGRLMSLEAYRVRYANLKKEQTDTLFTITLRGRVYAVRHSGSRLLFFTIVDRHQSMQIICSLSSMAASGVTEDEFKKFSQIVRKGDWFSISGYPEKTKSGTVSLRAVHLPQVLSPSLHEHPENLADKEIKARKRHVHLIANPEAGDLLRLRTEIEYSLQTYFREESFTKVSTPILAARAGGAAARPFETVATEFANRPLQLRVAPELFLKRLIVGGIKGVYEIGPVFRNEGVDLTHNPEFTICEFYKPLANLQDLMDITQTIFKRMQKMFNTRREVDFTSLPELDVDFSTSIQKLDFIETVEKALGQRMPDLNSPESVNELVRIMKQNDIPLPSASATPSTLANLSSSSRLNSTSEAEGGTINPSNKITPISNSSAITLPRLLDTLSKTLIEPQCGDPTFIIHHPAVMSPLAKSFIDPRSGQTVSARAELFVRGREYVNCYEEENSPFEQRRKMEEQILLRRGGERGHTHQSLEDKAPASNSASKDNEESTPTTILSSSSEPAPWSSPRTETNRNASATSSVSTSASTETPLDRPSLDEENYLEALEWALPPTGGWGVGIDRLVMLFSGQNRIGNVLPFGTLRNVVGLHHHHHHHHANVQAETGTATATWKKERRKMERAEWLEKKKKKKEEKKEMMNMTEAEDGSGKT